MQPENVEPCCWLLYNQDILQHISQRLPWRTIHQFFATCTTLFAMENDQSFWNGYFSRHLCSDLHTLDLVEAKTAFHQRDWRFLPDLELLVGVISITSNPQDKPAQDKILSLLHFAFSQFNCRSMDLQLDVLVDDSTSQQEWAQIMAKVTQQESQYCETTVFFQCIINDSNKFLLRPSLLHRYRAPKKIQDIVLAPFVVPFTQESDWDFNPDDPEGFYESFVDALNECDWLLNHLVQIERLRKDLLIISNQIFDTFVPKDIKQNMPWSSFLEHPWTKGFCPEAPKRLSRESIMHGFCGRVYAEMTDDKLSRVRWQFTYNDICELNAQSFEELKVGFDKIAFEMMEFEEADEEQISSFRKNIQAWKDVEFTDMMRTDVEPLQNMLRNRELRSKHFGTLNANELVTLRLSQSRALIYWCPNPDTGCVEVALAWELRSR